MKKAALKMKGLEELNPVRKHVLAAIVMTVILMLVCALFSSPRFAETNDDTVMSAFAYGYFGEPSEKLVYINIIVGYMTRLLVSLLPGVPWYFLFQYLLVAVSFGTVIFLILERFDGYQASLPLAVLACYFSYDFFCSMQFSKTAAIAVAAGLLLLFYAFGRTYRLPYFLGGILAFGGALYRFRVFEMALIPMFGLGLFIGLPLLIRMRWRDFFKLCLPFFCVIVLCFGAEAFNKYQYNHDEEWADFWELNALRDTLQNSLTDESNSYGFPQYADNRELYDALNMTEGDYILFRAGNFGDTEVFTRSAIEKLVEYKPQRTINAAFLKGFSGLIWGEMLEYPAFISVCLAVIVALYCAVRKKKTEGLLLIIYQAVAFLCIEFYFFYRGRYLQARVDLGLFLEIVLILMLYCWETESFMPAKRGACVLIASVLAVTTVSHYHGIYTRDYEKKAAYEASELNDLLASDKDHFYFYYAIWSDMPDATYHPWQVRSTGFAENRSSLGTWRVTTPTVINKWHKYGIENPFRDMNNRSDVYLLCTRETYKNRVLTHIREHYDAEAGAHLVRVIEDKYSVYQINSEELKLDTENAVSGADRLCYEIQLHISADQLSVEGIMYLPGSNSFADNVYVGIESPTGEETFYYAVKTALDGHTDLLDGHYGRFYADAIRLPSRYNRINFYLKTADNLYVITNGDE